MNGSNEELQQESAGVRLEKFLQEKRLSQTALADMCEVSPQYINNIVRRGQRIHEDFASALADATHINLHWLFTGDGPMELRESEKKGLPEQFTDAVNLFQNGADTIERAAKQMDRLLPDEED
ncbi:MAG: helix-turn-helix domain-containing protein [Planctomycetota bacterium]